MFAVLAAKVRLSSSSEEISGSILTTVCVCMSEITDANRDAGRDTRPKIPAKPFSNTVFAMIKTLFGIPDRPDTRYLVEISLLASLVAFVIFAIAWYDDNVGYMKSVKHQIELLNAFGYKNVFRLKNPLSDTQLATFYKKLSDLGTLDKRDVIRIKQVSHAKLAHRAYFKPRPFYNNPFDSLHMTGLQQKMLMVSSLSLQLMYPFIFGFVVWFLLKYCTRYLFRAFAMFWLEVIFAFVIDWIVSEVKKVVAEVVNMVVKILTFGLVGSAVSVTMPNFQDYWNRWWSKYIQPMLNEIDDEYSCRFQAKARYVAAALEALMTPVNKIYSWWFILRTYAIDIPYNEFKELVLNTYPGFVERNARVADRLEEIDKRFLDLLKGNLSRQAVNNKTAALKKAQSPPKTTPIPVGPTLIDNRVTNKLFATDVCQVVK